MWNRGSPQEVRNPHKDWWNRVEGNPQIEAIPIKPNPIQSNTKQPNPTQPNPPDPVHCEGPLHRASVQAPR